jgi:excisionase family DNA binding protein
LTGNTTATNPPTGTGQVGTPNDHARSEFISVEEWARRVGVSGRSAYRAVKNNEVPGVYKTGRRILINWAAFVASTYDAA